MWRMLQQPTPQDYVIGTGQTHSVRDLVEAAFGHVGLNWQDHVATDPKFMRPAEVDLLLADPTKARQELKWSPKVGFRELIAMMVDADLERLSARR
jgi:GDPmannose 4,6-dehydratase